MASADRLIEVFTEAKTQAAGAERDRFVAGACRDDPALRTQVLTLLAAHDGAGDFLKHAQLSLSPASVPTEKPGDRIGRYKLLQQIGEGGCGVVYMAEQEEPVRRRVALKVIKLGMDTKQVIARFEAERQALALMDHPNIAKVLDAGAAETGRPYFVMELVRGIKITEFCDDNRLSTEDRLKLFIQVCQAIQHAHQKGVIHRDIKPSNILVTINDGVPVPKVIDFGIAKATQGRLTDQTLFTAFEQFIGTPAYMSPEQAVLTSLDVDTRSDIYSLGVLLYELLTGDTPFDAKELCAAGLEEMRRTIREKEPARPSTRLRAMMEGELTTTAKHRHTDAPKLIHLLRGDLDWIVMKALEKDRARRYETANGLVRDVERFLADEPVVARPASNFYRFQKLARRNKLAFVAAGAVAAALIIGLAASTWEYVKERKAEKQARAINKFLTEDLLFQATPEQNAREKMVTMEEVLKVATSNLDHNAEVAQQPELEATLRLDIGSTYDHMGALAEAERNLRLALKLRRAALGPQHLDTLAAEHYLAGLLVEGKREQEEGGKLAREAWQGRQRLLGAEHRDTLESEELYVEALYETGQSQEAERLARQVLQIRQRLWQDDPDTIHSLENLGLVLSARGGAWAEAEHYIREARARFERLQPGFADTQNGLSCIKEIAILRLLQGDPAEAEKLMEEALPRARQRLGPDHNYTLFIQRVLVRALAEVGRLDEAEALGKETLDARLRTRVNQDEFGTARTMLYLGRVLVQENKLDEAEPWLQEALTTFLRDGSMKSRPELAAQAENWLGAIQIGRKAYPQAEALMLPGSGLFFAAKAEISPNERRLAVGHIVRLYEAWEKPEEAAVWRQKLDGLAKP
jgi:serine/threonine protein kinase